MKNIEEKIQGQISRIKEDIIDITNNIESFRNDGDVDNVGVGQELLDKLEILNEKLNILKKKSTALSKFKNNEHFKSWTYYSSN